MTPARLEGGGLGVLLPDKFGTPPLVERVEGRLPLALPNVDGGVVVYGYGPEVHSLLSELERRAMASVVIEEDETAARRLHARGQQVVHVTLAEQELDLRPLARARALVLNGEDDANVLLALSAREVGYEGPIVATIQDPRRRASMPE